VCGGKPKRFLGVPKQEATFNKWRTEITYQPAAAQILNVSPFAEVPVPIGGTSMVVTDVLSTTPAPPTGSLGGKIVLDQVGFAAVSSRPLWDSKTGEIRVGVIIEAQMPDGSVVTRKEYLGKRPLMLSRDIATPLYDAGMIVGPSLRRFSGRDADKGGDGWATKGAYEFLGDNRDLIFNDISLEHGGPFPGHPGGHPCGVSIDTRYLGPEGESVGLNGLGSDLDGAGNETGATRKQALEQAKVEQAGATGTGPKLVAIVAWIQQNRSRMQLLRQDSRLNSILIGEATWNVKSLLEGKYEDGTPIAGSGGIPVGAWARTKIVEDSGHLNHIHIRIR
jgi:hypothetical protein